MTIPIVEEEVELPPGEVATLVEAEGDAQDAIADNLIATIIALWAAFTDFYDGDAARQVAERIGRLVSTAQSLAGRMTEAHLRQQIALMGPDLARSLPGSAIVDLPVALRYGADAAEVYTRPIRQVRYLESVEHVPRETAVETARARLERAALHDLQLARAVAAQQVLYRFPQASGWRRIIHPELGNVCGLCVAASDRVYQRINRMDIHPGCKCTILPIVGGLDPGGTLNAEDLTRLYEAAGSTASRALAAVRIETFEHGEMGRVLVPEGSGIKRPGQVKRDLSDVQLERRKAQLQRQVDEMRSRLNRRYDQWHADRLAQLEDLLGAA
jgi:hypothetical protein